MLRSPAGRRGEGRQGGVPRDRRPDHREPRRLRQGHPATTCMAELKSCHVILKGPTTTPRAGDPLAEHRERQRCDAQGAGPVRQRAPGQGARAGHRLDVLPREHRGRLRRSAARAWRSTTSSPSTSPSPPPRAPSASLELAYDYATQERQEPRLHRHQGEHHQDHRRQVLEALPGGGQGVSRDHHSTTGTSTS